MILNTLALLAALAFGQPSQLVPAQFRDFSGGLVDNIDAVNLPQPASPDLLNIVVDDPVGSLKPRAGIVQCGTTPSGNPATVLFPYDKADGTRNLIVSDNSTVWQTRDCTTWTTIKDNLSSTARPSMATVRNNVWMVNGSTHPWSWNGVTISTFDARTGTPNPAPPVGRYIEFWKERVWIARTTSDPSILQFSALTASDGNDLDPSTGTAAWPATNAFYIDQDGGSPIYAIKAFRNSLYVFKENGIWRIVFNSEFDNAVVKTLSSVGCRFNTAIVEQDNFLYFVGPDGIYAFDGEQSVRISDPIANKFAALNQPLVNEQFKNWSSQADFEAGTLSSASASYLPNSVVISTISTGLTNGGFESVSTAPWRCSLTGVTDISVGGAAECGLMASSPLEGRQSLIFALSGAGGGGSLGAYVYTLSGTTVASQTSFTAGPTTSTLNIASGVGQVGYFQLSRVFDATHRMDLYSSTFTIQGGNLTFQHEAYDGANLERGFYRFDNVKHEVLYASATWTSDVYNAVSVSTWSTFDATASDNGGSIVYQVRVGSDTGAVAARSWVTITPGSLINGTTDQIYAQVKVILSTTASSTTSPQVDDVTIAYFQGGVASNAIYAARWNNRVWIAASSGTAATTNNIVLVKSRQPLNSWVPYDLQIGPMARFNDRFYAAASTHSAIYRLDYGTNDNGRAINWYWQSRDEAWERPNHRKTLLEITADWRAGTATNAFVGYSRDEGATWTNKTVDMSGTGRGSKRLYVNGGNAHSFRFRVGSSTLDESATVTGLTGWARPWLIMGD